MIIYKYPVEYGSWSLKVSKNYKILGIKTQYNKPYIWIMVDKDSKDFVWVNFETFPTGIETQTDELSPLKYIDSFQPSQDYIYHVFVWTYDIKI